MKSFNLEEAKAGRPICTRNGDKARIICTDLKVPDFHIVAAVWDSQSKRECIIKYTDKGEYCIGQTDTADLMMADKEPKCPFKPFDKVLVRDTDMSEWDCEFFSKHTDKPHPFYCLHNVYDQCIPYNEETAHLVGTTDAPPEKYVIW